MDVFLGSQDRDKIIDLLGFLLNEVDNFLADDDPLFFENDYSDDDDDDDESYQFKTTFVRKLNNRSVENEDIKYLIDNFIDYNEGVFVLRKIPLLKSDNG